MLATGLVVCGGMLRIFAGRIEVYVFVLAAALVYLWLALDYLEGRRSWLAPTLALALALWVHVAALCLVPSWLALPWLAPGAERPTWRGVLATGSLLPIPLLACLFGLVAVGDGTQAADFREVVLQVLGSGQASDAPHRWVRGWASGPSLATDYVFLSVAHLKYLSNAAFVLGPATLPLLIGLAWTRPARFVAAPATRLLGLCCLPLVVYALVLRPIWGPFDWDLFALTALFAGLLAAHVLAQEASDALWQDLVPWLCGFGLCFVGLPLLAMDWIGPLPAGPLLEAVFDWDLMDPTSAAAETLRPWL